MQDIQIKVLPRTLAFKKPARTSRGEYRERKVWYIVLRYKAQNKTALGIGEAAPLYDLSHEYNQDYENTLRRFCREIESKNGEVPYESLRPYPSMLFGIETALLSARASLRGNPFLFFDNDFTRGRRPIPINGLVWMGSKEDMLREMKEKVGKGFHCVKFKIGAIDFDSELELIRTLRRHFSEKDITIRLDANGAFSPESALEKLERLSKYQIHSIEQPIRQGQWDTMRKLCERSPIPIALDEELIGIHEEKDKEDLLRAIRPHYIVLKPTLHGGIRGSEEWIQLAKDFGTSYWVTSALESNIGLNALAQWVSTLKDCSLRPKHQGLGTGSLFVENYEGTSLTLEGENLWTGNAQQRLFQKEVDTFLNDFHRPEKTMPVKTSGSTGVPKTIELEKEKMRASANMTCQYLQLHQKDTIHLCMPIGYIAGKMQIVRAVEGKMPLLVSAPSNHPLQHLHRAPDFSAMTPTQVWNSLQNSRERRLLRGIRKLIIGGGAVSAEIENTLKTFRCEIWSTYGMTETLSHIALRRLNGKDASSYYTPLPSVSVSIGKDGHLIIHAPHLSKEPLHTNDIAEVRADGTFRILGRKDNTVCCGGVKLQLETIEEKLRTLPFPFLLTKKLDQAWGEIVVMLYESTVEIKGIKERCRPLLPPYEIPKLFIRVDKLPLTETGKPSRGKAEKMAAKSQEISEKSV